MDLREKLRQRGLPETTYPIRVGRVVDVQAAREALDKATRFRDKTDGIDAGLEQAVVDAKAALNDCYEDVAVRALAPDVYEALVALHPPTDEQQDDDMLWNPDTFVPALLSACVDLPWSDQDWVEMCSAGPLALGEVTDLFQTAVSINGRAPDLRLGKRLGADGQFALEMAVCAAYRVPHTTFLSWTLEDRDKAIAWHIHQAETCRTCGTRPDEWDDNKGGHRRAYLADIVVCPGCEVRQREEAELQTERWKKVRGASVVMRPNPKAKKRRRRRGR